MRVMYLNPTGQLGGAETSLLAILSSLRRARASWPLRVVLAGDGPVRGAVDAIGVTTSVLPFPAAIARLGEHGARSDGGYIRLLAQLVRAMSTVPPHVGQLRREIESFRPDVIHTNGLKMHLLAPWATRSVPLVWHLHDYLGSRPLTARLMRWHASRCAVLVANSQSVAADASDALGGDVRIVPILNAVDLDRFSPNGDRADLDRLAGLSPAPAGTVRVGLLGTFARWKGHDVFLNAIAQLPGELPIRAYVIGDAVYDTDRSQHSSDELRRLAASLGIAARVAFTGFIPRSDTALRALDIVVHASTSPEPFGLVIAEAMACGRAVIVGRAGGAAELVSPGVDALAHTPGNVAELSSQIKTLTTDAVLRERLGVAARATAERRFDQRRLAGELIAVYESAVRPSAKASRSFYRMSASPNSMEREALAERREQMEREALAERNS